MRDADDVAEVLKRQRDHAPAEVADRAMQRVRFERSSWLLLRTLGGGLLRTVRAAPDYLGLGAGPGPVGGTGVDQGGGTGIDQGGGPGDEGPDTGEWPAPDAEAP